MEIKCEIDDFGGDEDDSVRAKCNRCGHVVRGASVPQCLFLMRQRCPGWKYHRYVEDDGIADPREQYEARYEGDPTCIFTAEGLKLNLRIEEAYDELIRRGSKQ